MVPPLANLKLFQFMCYPFSGPEPRTRRESTGRPIRRRTREEREARCLERKSVEMKEEMRLQVQSFMGYLFPFLTWQGSPLRSQMLTVVMQTVPWNPTVLHMFLFLKFHYFPCIVFHPRIELGKAPSTIVGYFMHCGACRLAGQHVFHSFNLRCRAGQSPCASCSAGKMQKKQNQHLPKVSDLIIWPMLSRFDICLPLSQEGS